MEDPESHIDLKKFKGHKTKSMWSAGLISKLLIATVLLAGLYYFLKIIVNQEPPKENLDNQIEIEFED